jgi:hypothetical protein
VQPKKKGPRPLLVVIIIVVLVALLGGGGAFFYISTRPKPVITTVTSTYHAGANVAGANTTTMTLKGTDFSGNSTVTIYLDNYTTIAPGSQPVQSDSNGNITATLTVTSDWSVGNHTLLAKDASGYQTKVGWPITIVTPGQDNTPGPNGAPPDDANMTITVSVQSSNDSAPESNTLIVTGSANGGTVCGKDDGTPQTDSGTLDNGDQYTETIILSCSGTYKGGKLTYTETATSYKLTDDTDGASCSAATPFVVAQMAGTFSSATDISGTYSSDATTLTCSLDGQSESEPIDASTGTWTGTALVN